MNSKSYRTLVLLLILGSSTPRLSAADNPGFVLLDDRGPETGFQSLFNGNDLTGWTGDPRLWSVQEGAITGQTTPQNPARGNTFLIWTNGTVADFELRCSFKLTANNSEGFANSGIQYRSKVLDPAHWVVGGYQADMEAGPTYTGILYEERMSRSIMAARGEKVLWDKDCKKQVIGSLGTSEELSKFIKRGDWNDYVIIAQGNHLQQFVNGHETVDVTDDCESKRAMDGVLALQLHAGQPMTAQFRNLRLKNLSAAGASMGEELQKLQGSWQVVRGQANGEAVPAETITNIVVTIKGSNYTALLNDRTDQGTVKINGSKQPKQMDIHPDSASDDTQLLGIYEVGPDTLRVCYSRRGAPRPTAFATAGDERLLLLEYIRKKP